LAADLGLIVSRADPPSKMTSPLETISSRSAAKHSLHHVGSIFLRQIFSEAKMQYPSRVWNAQNDHSDTFWSDLRLISFFLTDCTYSWESRMNFKILLIYSKFLTRHITKEIIKLILEV